MRTCPTCKVKYPMNVTFCLQDGTPLVEPEELTEGTVVRGKYRILSKTGQGDMSTMYKALHLRLDEVRALKVMNAELARDPLFLKRFEQEALLTRKLQHPNVVRVDDIDETDDGRPFMVMESVEGVSLKKVIQEEGPLQASRVCAITRQVASALDVAHQLGLIHRDIKPENIELVQTPSGEVAKVLEFGIAKLKEARVGESAGMLTLSGALAVIGTPQYMSPELAMGKRGDELDGRSDIYTLGIVMYEMLTGALPFKSGTMMNMIMAHVQTPPTPFQTVRPDIKIPEPLAGLVMKCLEKDRDSRPSSAKALIEALDRIEEQQPAQPVAAEPKPPVEVAPPPPKPAAPVPEQAVSPKSPPDVLPPPPKPAPAEPPAAAIPQPPAPEPPPPAPSVPAAQARRDVEAARAPIPGPAAVGAAAPAKRSRSAVVVSVLIAVIVLGIGVWYVASPVRKPSGVTPVATPGQTGGAPANQPKERPNNSQPQPSPAAPANTAGQATGSAPANQPAEPPAVSQPSPAAPGGTQAAGQPSSESSQAAPRAVAGEGTPAQTSKTRKASSAGVREQIRAAVRQGDYDYDNGEYDNALREYEKGLKLDPSNALVRQRIQRAQKAKATEDALK